MSATLKNKDRQPHVVVLDHPTFASREHGWKRTTAKFGASRADGSRDVTEVRRAYPGSLTLMPGETVKDLPHDIQKCSQVATLVARGLLEVTFVEDPPAEKPARQRVDREVIQKQEG